MNNVYLGGINGTKNNKLKWSKIRAGSYVTRIDDYYVVISQIKDKDVETTNWWTTAVYDLKGNFLEELENYITLTESKDSVEDNFYRWLKWYKL